MWAGKSLKHLISVFNETLCESLCESMFPYDDVHVGLLVTTFRTEPTFECFLQVGQETPQSLQVKVVHLPIVEELGGYVGLWRQKTREEELVDEGELIGREMHECGG